MPKKKHMVDENGLGRADKLFCEEYLNNGNNGTQAYIAAHPKVKETTAKVCASRLLTKVNIQAYIKKVDEEALYAAGVDKKKIIQTLAASAFRKGLKITETGQQAALDKLCKIMKLYDPNELPPPPDGEDGDNPSVVVYLPRNTRFKCA